jgi:predicted DNA-binding transcriptional regulator AlpA
MLEEQKELMRARELRDFLNISPSTLWRLRQKRSFPKPIVISERILAWRKSEIDNWLNDTTRDISDF